MSAVFAYGQAHSQYHRLYDEARRREEWRTWSATGMNTPTVTRSSGAPGSTTCGCGCGGAAGVPCGGAAWSTGSTSDPGSGRSTSAPAPGSWRSPWPIECAPGGSVDGVDAAVEMVRRAERNNRRRPRPVTFTTARAQQLPFPDETFDAVDLHPRPAPRRRGRPAGRGRGDATGAAAGRSAAGRRHRALRRRSRPVRAAVPGVVTRCTRAALDEAEQLLASGGLFAT